MHAKTEQAEDSYILELMHSIQVPFEWPQVALNPRNTVFDVKRLIGRKFNDPAVQQDMKHWPFKVVDGPDHKPLIEGEELLPCCHSPTQYLIPHFAPSCCLRPSPSM